MSMYATKQENTEAFSCLVAYGPLQWRVDNENKTKFAEKLNVEACGFKNVYDEYEKISV